MLVEVRWIDIFWIYIPSWKWQFPKIMKSNRRLLLVFSHYRNKMILFSHFWVLCDNSFHFYCLEIWEYFIHWHSLQNSTNNEIPKCITYLCKWRSCCFHNVPPIFVQESQQLVLCNNYWNVIDFMKSDFNSLFGIMKRCEILPRALLPLNKFSKLKVIFWALKSKDLSSKFI